ncbi:XdhC family protein [Brachybacterium muris]|uniref:Xanthine dehydrogenase n=1 Tax=Brachybacterium muris UCD-AY4 TaxID=1249481 RepID=A0A022KYT5_9MICO|nr:XdhC/CoxI family protein [Brachybacterium muris]EYT51004.1 xanthine dehydrogenase [Brachybacterium muris UCD-AY4]MCT1654355.1 XdhC family protein [Brachybacterium muris]
MLDILDGARERLARASDPVPCAVATIVSAQGSVPRPVGTSMLVGADGALRGSLSGGCVEGAVLEACREAIETGRSSLRSFGFSEEDAFAVGLMCGGSLEVLIQPFAPPPPGTQSPLGTVSDPSPAAYVTRLPQESDAPPAAAPGGDDADGPRAVLLAGDGAEEVRGALTMLLPPELLEAGSAQVAAMLREARTGTLRLPAGASTIDLFVESRIRPAHLVVCGANAFGQALVEAARPLGLRITLCDHRPAFTDPTAFPGAEVVRAWPHRFLAAAAERGDLDARSMVCVLTHDPKVDVPVLATALRLDIAYVGAMGSRRSDHDRRTALREAGVDEEALSRLRSPIGLDLGAESPAEVAIAILAEILAVRAERRTVEPLRDGSGPLHARTAASG